MNGRRQQIVVGLFIVAAVSIVAAGFGCEKKESPPTATATKPAETVAVVNGVCPIMGNKIDKAKVPADLTREFKGQKVGFCCAMCPPAWDKLTDDEKTAKLAKAMPAMHE